MHVAIYYNDTARWVFQMKYSVKRQLQTVIAAIGIDNE